MDYVLESDAPIILDSIGDGEVFLRHSGQPGRLVNALASENGRTVSVKFAFDSDMVSARHERTLGGGLFDGESTDAFAFRYGKVQDETRATFCGHYIRLRKTAQCVSRHLQ